MWLNSQTDFNLDRQTVFEIAFILNLNVSSMAGTFSKEKLTAYIEETRHYVLPLLRKAKAVYPNDSDVLFALKYHICSVVDSVEAMMKGNRSIIGSIPNSV